MEPGFTKLLNLKIANLLSEPPGDIGANLENSALVFFPSTSKSYSLPISISFKYKTGTEI